MRFPTCEVFGEEEARLFETVRGMLEGLPHTNEYVFPSPKTEGRLDRREVVALIWRRARQESKISASTTCVTQQPRGWLTVERMLSRLQRSSVGQTFEWLFATLTRLMRRSGEQSKTWLSPISKVDQVTNR